MNPSCARKLRLSPSARLGSAPLPNRAASHKYTGTLLSLPAAPESAQINGTASSSQLELRPPPAPLTAPYSLADAAMHHSQILMHHFLRLQWSHDLSAMDTRQPRRSIGRRIGFNGAMTSQPWIRSPVQSASSTSSSLQWSQMTSQPWIPDSALLRSQ